MYRIRFRNYNVRHPVFRLHHLKMRVNLGTDLLFPNFLLVISRKVTGTLPGCTEAWEIRRNWSNFQTAHQSLLSVRLNCSAIFEVTLSFSLSLSLSLSLSIYLSLSLYLSISLSLSLSNCFANLYSVIFVDSWNGKIPWSIFAQVLFLTSRFTAAVFFISVLPCKIQRTFSENAFNF